jgi:P27 family predicted phage terminase small subunit
MSRKKAPGDKVGNSTAKAVEVMATNVAWVTPEPPVSLESRDLWDAVWELGGPSQVYHPVADYGIIARYCELQERRARLMKVIDERGFTDIGSQGQEVQRPEVRILADVEGKIGPIEDRLGLNPVNRQGLAIGHVQAKSKFEEWLSD